MTTRMLLRGGLVADGIATTIRPADVLIDGQLIASVGGNGAPPADCEVIDLASGSVVCPGFVDAHVHGEGALLATGRVDGALAQGVTTLVVGQDGESWIGATTGTARYLNQYFAPVNGALEPARDLSVAGYRDAVSGRLTQNVAVLASQGTIRHNIVGLAPGPLGPDERAAARREVENALSDGAVGLSSGLDYLPSRFGGTEEVADIARPLAAAGRPYVSHLRGYGPEVRAGLDELVAVGRNAGIRVHASHLWGAPADIRGAFTSAEAAGVAVTDPRRRAALLAGEKFTDDFLQDLYLACLPARAAEFAGQSVTQAAAGSSQSAAEWVLDLLVSAELSVGAHLDRPALSDDHLVWLRSDDRHCAGSDGIYQGQHPHPRGYGTFARLAEQYLANGPGTGYQQLARHLSANAADAYGLRKRGRLAPGMAADVCVIGPRGTTSRASYDTPQEKATGVDLVIVNGVITWRDGQPVTTGFPGQFVN